MTGFVNILVCWQVKDGRKLCILRDCRTFAEHSTNSVSFIIVFILIALTGTVAELLASKNARLQQQIYYCTFVLVALWCILKYAIGPDISTYIPFYQELGSVADTFTHLDKSQFEPGFTLFCSLLHSMGVSFWGMTAVISVFYFVSIYLLFQKIERYKTLSLLMLVCLDYNLILMEFRQCLAVSFFYLFILLLEKRQYAWSILMALLSCTMHKSAIILLVLFGLLYLIGKVSVDKREYILLGLLIIGFLLIPLQPLLMRLVDMLPLTSIQAGSIKHHLQLGTPFQVVLIVYISTIFCLAYYIVPKENRTRKHWLVWCSVAVLVCLYPYWFLLNRLRSYFLPFLIVYVANTLCASERKDVLVKQIYATILVLYTCVVIVGLPKKAQELRYPTGSISLVTERYRYSQEALQARQVRQAKLYWKYDYPEVIRRGKQ